MTARIHRLAAALLAASGPLAAPPLHAQQPAPPPTIDACYVPASGTIYRIGTSASPAPGAPTACLAPTHVRFTWNQQGPAGPTGPQGPQGVPGRDGPPGVVPKTAVGAYDLSNDDGILAGGRVGSCTTNGAPAGPGTRMLWYPCQGAFRAGAVAGSYWSPAELGKYSVAFGFNTRASGTASTVLGYYSAATGFVATAIGNGASASGAASTAIGNQVSTNEQTGALVLGDASTPTTTSATVPNQLTARFAGGYRLYSNPGLTAGVSLASGGGSWQSVSDVRRKTAFRDVDGEALLGKLAAIPVRTWQYRSQDAAIRHMGPTAQDFRAAFALGESDTTITSVDADGVALAAGQALERRTAALRAEGAWLRARLGAMDARLRALEMRADVSAAPAPPTPAVVRTAAPSRP